jgi:glycine oxidase
VDLFGLRWLADYAHERFPLLKGELFVGEVAKGVYAAVGHGRNGVLLAPWTARRLLGLLGVEG